MLLLLMRRVSFAASLGRRADVQPASTSPNTRDHHQTHIAEHHSWKWIGSLAGKSVELGKAGLTEGGANKTSPGHKNKKHNEAWRERDGGEGAGAGEGWVGLKEADSTPAEATAAEHEKVTGMQRAEAREQVQGQGGLRQRAHLTADLEVYDIESRDDAAGDDQPHVPAGSSRALPEQRERARVLSPSDIMAMPQVALPRQARAAWVCAGASGRLSCRDALPLGHHAACSSDKTRACLRLCFL